MAERTARATSTHTRAAASDNLVQPVRSGGSAVAAATTILPDAQEDYFARVEREQRMPDAGIYKPSRGEILTAGRVSTYREGNVEFALPVQLSIKKRQDTRRFARKRKNIRKKQLREYCRDLERKIRIPDPPSGGEGAPVFEYMMQYFSPFNKMR